MSLTITTNNVPRNVIDAYELTPAERSDFDYLNWTEIEQGTDSATFFRFKGTLYDLGEFMHTGNMPEFTKWHGYQSDSFFSGILVRYTEDMEQVIIATYYS